MKIATFKTEFLADVDRARVLLEHLNLHLLFYRETEDLSPSTRVGIFTIRIPEGQTVEDVRAQMDAAVESGGYFADLHRCGQTLLAGYEPDWNWFTDVKPEPETWIKPKRLYFQIAKSSPYCSDARSELYESGLLIRSPAELTAQAVLADLLDRRSIGNQLDDVDDDIRDEIVDSITGIIETMYPADTARPDMVFFHRVLNEVSS